MSQLARLFLRGSLMNETAKFLNSDDMRQVEALMKEAWDDPALQGQKAEFCMALGRTIGNEYKDFEAGKQDALIAFWKAALLVLFHESKQCSGADCRAHLITTKMKMDNCPKCGGELILKWSPKPQIAQDPIKRKKFFQSVLFNYLRQIFRENKPAAVKEVKTEEGLAHDVAVKVISAAIDKIKGIDCEVERVDGEHFVIRCETGLLPLKVIKQINDLKNDFDQYGIQISADWAQIGVISALEIPETISCQIISKVYAKFTSLDSGSDDETDSSFRDHCEHRVLTKTNTQTPIDQFEYNETVDTIRERLSDDARKLFDLIIDTPQDYIDRFGTNKLYRLHLAQYLGKEAKEIDEIRENIRVHCLVMGLGVE
jgi:hypothetical protein